MSAYVVEAEHINVLLWAAHQGFRRPLTGEDIERLNEVIPFSLIPEAIDTIVSSWDD
jgi:hypothetical protein